LRVIKLGGSLLELSDLRVRFDRWLRLQQPAFNLLVAGGGQTVETLRCLDAIHRFDQAWIHWLCIDLMATTAQLAGALLGLPGILSTAEELSAYLARHRHNQDSAANPVVCIQPSAYYTPAASGESKCPLPESWDCTSDSVSAWLSRQIAADQLVLLKSTSASLVSNASQSLSASELSALASSGVVDAIFPSLARDLPCVRIANLRALTG